MTDPTAATAAPEGQPAHVVRVHERIADVPRAVWDRFAGTSRASGAAYNPFMRHDFLSALEEAGCAIADTGWHGQHLVLEDGGGNALAAAPAYLKAHSQGEYVFDHAWADAWERAGGRYYPKLQLSVPFTPATGPRLLIGPDVNAEAARAALANAIAQLTERLGLSSAHVTFAQKPDLDALLEAGFLHRTDQQFHFINKGYGSYAEFLETLSSRKRKALKKERATALENGITIDWLTGSDITEAALDDFYVFYTDTGERKWGRPYLNRRFFSLVAERMADDILLVMASRNGRNIAGAINFIGGDTIFGRHWGCVEHHRFLHFEVCYHQAIDFAIERKLAVVEAGAQGEHKLARGYLPVTTHSAHFIPHEGFRKAIEDYLHHERADVARFGKILADAGPFRKAD
ncbi:GNAT family N-acetyltransferase [Oceaniradius stylonematis]|uniref:GNAT family N-acetyltransferase n=1 Tax=Oceaniradius stylonematis TaxID=2184161 RepID=UPI00273D14CC|nr:GNAT family N-acetyltransferase [Oceaniradius stylonematis]